MFFTHTCFIFPSLKYYISCTVHKVKKFTPFWLPIELAPLAYIGKDLLVTERIKT
jgi:hypothetical protein